MIFSSMTPQEIFKYHASENPNEIVEAFEKMLHELNELEVERDILKREKEISNEQVWFGRDLVGELDKFMLNEAPDHCSKKSYKDLKNKYDTIRSNTLFET